MNIAIKVLAWYTLVIVVVSAVNVILATINGRPVTYTPLICVVNLILLVPMVAFGILVIIRMRRGG